MTSTFRGLRFVLLPLALLASVCTLAASGSVTYTYDSAGRLVQASYGVAVLTTYQLDAAGNRIQVNYIDDTVAPPVPVLTATATSTSSAIQVTLHWTTVTDTGGSGLKGYNIFRGGVLQNSTMLGPTAISYVDNTVSAGVAYSYTIISYDNAGNASAASTPATITPADTIPPSAPGIPTITNVNGAAASATATWTAATDNVGVTSYEYSLNGGAFTAVGLALTVNLTGLNTAATTTIAVHAKDAVGNTSASSSKSFSFTLPPTALTATAVSPALNTLAWTAPTSGVIAGYDIYRNGVQIGTSATPSYQDTTVVPGTAYTYTVDAFDSSVPPNRSALSNGSSVTTLLLFQITDSAGTVLPSAASLYSSVINCQIAFGEQLCAMTVTQKYGALAVVWTIHESGTASVCNGASNPPEASGYSRPAIGSCEIDATPAAYGH